MKIYYLFFKQKNTVSPKVLHYSQSQITWKTTTVINSKTWIGLFQSKKNINTWKWTGNESSSYRNWKYRSEINNFTETFDCVYVRIDYSRKDFSWMDNNCQENLKFLCFTQSSKVMTEWVGWNNLTEFNDNNQLYGYLFESYENWKNAESRCAEFNAHLASFGKSINYSDILDTFNIKDDRIWIGLNDIDNEGIWEWSDNSKLEFSKWAKNYPTNNHKNCVYFDHEDSKWTQYECSQKLTSICKKNGKRNNPR
ncbi:hypothetical protein MXB_1360, partial [Myxobolus squamalis]